MVVLRRTQDYTRVIGIVLLAGFYLFYKVMLMMMNVCLFNTYSRYTQWLVAWNY